MSFVKKFLSLNLIFGLTVILFPQFAKGADQTLTFTFEKEKLAFKTISGYDFVTYGDLELSSEIAAPQLPVKIIQIVLPPGREIQDVSIQNLETELIEGEFLVFPAQSPQVLSDENVRSVYPDQSLYASSSPYPGEIVKVLQPQSNFSDQNIGSIAIFPIQYLPSEKKLRFHTRIEVDLVFKDSRISVLPRKGNQFRQKALQGVLKDLVVNPVDISSSSSGQLNSSNLPNEEHFYVIITSDNLVQNFQPLADWKRKKGLSAKKSTNIFKSIKCSLHPESRIYQSNADDFVLR